MLLSILAVQLFKALIVVVQHVQHVVGAHLYELDALPQLLVVQALRQL